MLTLYVIGIVIYGIARGIQQSCIFNYRDGRVAGEWLDDASEIHFYGWFEPLGLVLGVLNLYSWMQTHSIWWLTFFIPATYILYWLPYGLMFCYNRNKLWFAPGQMYNVMGLKLPLLGKLESIILWFIVIGGIVWIGRV